MSGQFALEKRKLVEAETSSRAKIYADAMRPGHIRTIEEFRKMIRAGLVVVGETHTTDRLTKQAERSLMSPDTELIYEDEAFKGKPYGDSPKLLAASYLAHSRDLVTELSGSDQSKRKALSDERKFIVESLQKEIDKMDEGPTKLKFSYVKKTLDDADFDKGGTAEISRDIRQVLIDQIGEDEDKFDTLRRIRSDEMHKSANMLSDVRGVWKVGDLHVTDIVGKYPENTRKYKLMSRSEFQKYLDSAKFLVEHAET